jgi:hypothetical protein
MKLTKSISVNGVIIPAGTNLEFSNEGLTTFKGQTVNRKLIPQTALEAKEGKKPSILKRLIDFLNKNVGKTLSKQEIVKGTFEDVKEGTYSTALAGYMTKLFYALYLFPMYDKKGSWHVVKKIPDMTTTELNKYQWNEEVRLASRKFDAEREKLK